MSLWFRIASERGYDRVRDGIANVLADLSESLHGVRVVTAHNRQRHNVVHHRNVVGRVPRRQHLHGPDQRHLRPGHPAAGLPGPGGAPGRRRRHGAAPHSALGALVAFFLYLNRFFQPIQLLVQQYNTYQQGQASVIKLRTLLTTEPTVTEAPDAVELPADRGRDRLRAT